MLIRPARVFTSDHFDSEVCVSCLKGKRRPEEWRRSGSPCWDVDDPMVARILELTQENNRLRRVVSALRQIGRLKKAGEDGHVPIVGFDGTPLGLQRIRDGFQDGDVGQNPFSMGSSILDSMEAYLTKKPFEKKTLIQPVMITKENVDDPNNWGNRVKPS